MEPNKDKSKEDKIDVLTESACFAFTWILQLETITRSNQSRRGDREKERGREREISIFGWKNATLSLMSLMTGSLLKHP